jgi:tRNA threonylcarbamoyladenosine modification (KEOPS) complex  Pcc1 subunit
MNVKESISNKACITLTFSSEECNIAETIYNSIFAEVVNPANVGKIVTNIDLNGCTIKICIKADTLSHLRAFLNSILYLTNTSIEVIKIEKKKFK